MCHQCADRAYSLLGRPCRRTSTVVQKYPTYVQGERQRHGQTYRRRISATTPEEVPDAWLTSDGLLTVTQDSQKCPPWSSTQAMHETDFLGYCFLLPRLTGAVCHDYLRMSFQSCWKMWICRLQFIYGLCITVLHRVFFLQFGNSWTCFRNNGWDDVDQQHGLHLCLI